MHFIDTNLESLPDCCSTKNKQTKLQNNHQQWLKTDQKIKSEMSKRPSLSCVEKKTSVQYLPLSPWRSPEPSLWHSGGRVPEGNGSWMTPLDFPFTSAADSSWLKMIIFIESEESMSRAQSGDKKEISKQRINISQHRFTKEEQNRLLYYWLLRNKCLVSFLQSCPHNVLQTRLNCFRIPHGCF